jgi:DNA-binding MarR family transcriptional regulator
MNKKEKKAIEYLKDDIKSYLYLLNNDDKQKDYYIKEYPNMEAKRILLNLVEKQQKEIEELNKNKQQINYNEIFSPDFVEENFISKDKIREKLNYFEHSFDYDDDGTSYELVMEVLDELLEE